MSFAEVWRAWCRGRVRCDESGNQLPFSGERAVSRSAAGCSTNGGIWCVGIRNECYCELLQRSRATHPEYIQWKEKPGFGLNGARNPVYVT